MSQSDILWRVIGACVVVTGAVTMHRFANWKRRQSAAAAEGLSKARAMILEHPQSLGLLIGETLLLSLLTAALGWIALALARHPFGLYPYLAALAVVLGASVGVWACLGVVMASCAARRMRGERPDLAAAYAAFGRVARGLYDWALSHFGTAREPMPTTLAIAVVLTDGLQLAEAGRRAAALTAQAPYTAEAVRAAQERLAPARAVVLYVTVPMCASAFALPLVPYAGYKASLLAPYGFERLGLYLIAPGAALILAGLYGTVKFAASLAHAAAAYLYVAGGAAARERLAARFGTQPLAPGAGFSSAPARAAAVEPYVESRPLPQSPFGPAADMEPPPVQDAYPEQPAGWAPPPSSAAGPAGAVYDWNQPAAPPPTTDWASARAAGDTASRRTVPLPSRALKGLLRAGLLVALAVGGVAAFRALDGRGLGARLYLRAWGQNVWGKVERMDAEPRMGSLFYRVRYTYEAASVVHRADAMVGEGAMGRLDRGRPVLLRVMVEDPKRSCVDDDFGYTAQGAAVLIGALALLAIGGWSFIFRVL